MLRVKTAYRLAATAPRSTLQQRACLAAGCSAAARLVLRATVAQYASDVARCVLLLQRAASECTEPEVPYVLDLLAPIYVTLEDPARLEDVLARAVPPSALRPSHLALRSILAAMQGDPATSRELRGVALRAAENCGDRLVLGRTLQRLALAAYRVGDGEDATELALRSAQQCTIIKAHRTATAAYSVAYNVHQTLTGDIERALDFADRMTHSARLAGHESFERCGLIARYEILAELGDGGGLAALRKEFRRHPLPQQYRERFACGIADLLPFAWSDDFNAFRSGMTLLHDVAARTRGERALCLALRGLAEAADGEDEAARRLSRAALASSDFRSLRESVPYELRYHRLAHVVAAATCIIIGDAVRGRRLLEATSVRSWADGVSCAAVVDGQPWRLAAPRVRGYARVIARAWAAARNRRSPVGLTGGELKILRLLALGMSAPQIALKTMRSVHTVRAHTRSIIAKFGVNGRYAAIHQARQVGVLR